MIRVKKAVKRGAGFTLIELMIVVAIIGILAALAIPNFMKFLTKTKQSEARVNLGALYVCQMSYFGENETFAGTTRAFDLVGFDPKDPMIMRYVFLMDDAEIVGPKAPSSYPPGLKSSSIAFTAMAVGNVDQDPFLDVWAINDKKDLRNRMPTASGWGADGSDVQNE